MDSIDNKSVFMAWCRKDTNQLHEPITRKMFPFDDVIMLLPTGVGYAVYAMSGYQRGFCRNPDEITSNGSWCIGIKGEMSGTVCVTFTRDIYIYIWVVYSFCLFCCLFIIVTWWYMWCVRAGVNSGIGIGIDTNSNSRNWNCKGIE